MILHYIFISALPIPDFCWLLLLLWMHQLTGSILQQIPKSLEISKIKIRKVLIKKSKIKNFLNFCYYDFYWLPLFLRVIGQLLKTIPQTIQWFLNLLTLVARTLHRVILGRLKFVFFTFFSVQIFVVGCFCQSQSTNFNKFFEHPSISLLKC